MCCSTTNKVKEANLMGISSFGGSYEYNIVYTLNASIGHEEDNSKSQCGTSKN